MMRWLMTAGVALALVTGADPLAGQAPERLLPAVPSVRPPAADPHAARLSVALVSTNLLATRGPERPAFKVPNAAAAAREVVAAVSLGGVLPLVQLGAWPDGQLTLVADGRVFARFRVEKEERDDMGQDWYIGGGVEAVRGRWAGRALLMHRSSHLGDEFMVDTDARRIEFGSEHLDLLVARDVAGVARFYGGGSLILRSYLDWDPWLRELGFSDRAIMQAGADRQWRPWSDDRWQVTAGVDVQLAERTEWRRQLAGSIAAGFDARQSGRSLQLVLRAFDGPSLMGEFFLTPERYWGLELQARF
jgi:hypothetical protein